MFCAGHMRQSVLNVLRPLYLLLLFSVLRPGAMIAQDIDILLRGGHLIDAKNKINGRMDIAVSKGRIVKVSPSIPSEKAERVIDLNGLYVTPGLIDIHTHVFVGPEAGFANGFYSVSPDDFTFKSGVTTVADAGTSGWRSFPLFKKQVIDRSQTRVLAFLNIAGSGMTGFPSEEDINDMDARMTSLVIGQYPDIIVGVKIGHYRGSDWTPFDRAAEAAGISDVPLLVECHLPLLPLEGILSRMKEGDIYTHSFCVASDRECLLDEKGRIKPFVAEARKKGIRFDVGHGGGMFHFNVAIPAFRQGLWPDSFGTDLHRISMNSGMKNMLDIMSKYLNIGMSFEDIISRATWNPAQSLKREDLGHLGEGAVADIAVFSIREGRFGFIDAAGYRLDGDRRIETELTIRAGRVVYDQNGISARSWLENQTIKF
ncbi:MAG TPA: amidohydrolase/deacetylase family metallohydrolase, partial [Bacteroidales bacterium]|nr:amidohydrolase/deacetylase family metallohydrolase [Bacteroidales bacterium]